MPFSLIQKNKFDFCWYHLFNSYKNYVKPDSVVLEIGASTINKTRDLSYCCRRVIGIEKYKSRKPSNFNNVKYVLGDWQNLSTIIQPETIDIIVSSHTIEHVEHDLEAINQLYAVLKPGGVALLNTPNRKRLGAIVQEFFTGKRKFPCGEHIREYTIHDLKDLLNRSFFRGSFKIVPVAFGFHAGFLHLYTKNVSGFLKEFSIFWEIHLFKR